MKTQTVEVTRHIFGKTYTTEKIMVPTEDFGQKLQHLINVLKS